MALLTEPESPCVPCAVCRRVDTHGRSHGEPLPKEEAGLGPGTRFEVLRKATVRASEQLSSARTSGLKIGQIVVAAAVLTLPCGTRRVQLRSGGDAPTRPSTRRTR